MCNNNQSYITIIFSPLKQNVMKKIFILLLVLYSNIIVQAQVQCNNWLRMPTYPSTVSIGNLNVTGNQITVEGNFNCTSYSTPNFGGNIIAKHTTAANTCYALSPHGAEISTSNNGYRFTLQTCAFQLNKTYHVAMVYDGASLKFYRDGFLMSQTPCSGNISSNTLNAIIGNGPALPVQNQFNGYINEVRIWSIARTQVQLQTFMNTPLPNPAGQTGLLAYYTFDNLLNKQGNTAFNGVINDGATINATNPNCTFIADSCCSANTRNNLVKCSNQNIELIVRAGTTYSWFPAIGLSATNIQNPICSATTNTTYIVTVTNGTSGCINIDTINIIVNPAVISNIKDTTICNRDSVRLVAPAGYTYSWSPATYINSTTISNPLIWPPITTSYVVTITNSFGCITRDTVLVTVNDCGCEDSCNWSKTGNTFVKPTNFIGSKNNADFKVRTNNTQRMVVTAGGNIGLNTTAPTKTLDVNGEAIVRTLPASNPNDRLVLANTIGELKSLAPGTAAQYLSGDGTWQTLPSGGGTVTAADQGVTLDGSTVQLGDNCQKGGGAFKSNREVNMNDYNLYFNSANQGKVRIGSNIFKDSYCPELFARLEISSRGLKGALNEYASPTPSSSGLRFTELTSLVAPIENKSNGVLSLDEDGDVIWVNACCNQLGKDNQITSILERLDKLENELKTVKNENAVLKNKLNLTEVTLEYKQNILEQNVPNPFTETTTIGYTIVNSFSKAVIVFYSVNGNIIKSVQLTSVGKGQINVSANLVAKGVYNYSLIVDGKLIETKKMIKE
jgi:hypothetical protein